MVIKWTEKDALEALRTLSNPFAEQAKANATQNNGQKARIPSTDEILAIAAQNNGANEVVNQ